MSEPVAVPARLRHGVARWLGTEGEAWLAALPATVHHAARRWDLVLGEPFEPGGQLGWLAPCVRADGTDAVLKVQAPDADAAREAPALAAWAGAGAARLVDHDAARRVLLLERCRPGTTLAELGGTDDAVRAGAELLTRLHTPPPPAGLPDLQQVLVPWADEVEARAAARGWPHEAALLAEGLRLMRTLAPRAPEHVLLHGDLNPTNVLAAERAPWLAIDPKGMVGDPAYDGARLVLQPDPGPPAALARRLDLVAAAAGLDRDRLRRWCVVDCVELAVSATPPLDPVAPERAAELARVLLDL